MEEKILLPELPPYGADGSISDSVYDAGSSVGELTSPSPRHAALRIVRTENPGEGHAHYLRRLTDAGFTVAEERELGGDLYTALRGNGRLVRLSTRIRANELRVLLDCGEHLPAELSASDSGASDRSAEFFMYGLNMDPGGYNIRLAPEYNTSGYLNCGMLLAIRCRDGGIIVIDGGSGKQMLGGAAFAVDRFLHTVAGVEKDSPVRIAAWLITHTHDDHLNGFREFLLTRTERYSLERLLVNLPPLAEFAAAGCLPDLTTLSGFLKEKYPLCRELKLHTGDRLTLSDVTLDVLYTHEDAVNAETGCFPSKNYNDVTTVVRATLGEMRVLITGDIDCIAEETMCRLLPPECFRSDILQVAHHDFYPIERAYAYASAKIACFPQTEAGTVKNDVMIANTAAVKRYSEYFYYSGDVTKTVGFGMREGKIAQIFRYDRYIDPQPIE